MLNNFIGGGQVFLHKVRMLRQVMFITIFVSLISGILLVWATAGNKYSTINWDGAYTYFKAKTAVAFHPSLSAISIGKKREAKVDAYSNGKLWKKNAVATSVIMNNRFSSAWQQAVDAVIAIGLQILYFAIGVASLIMVVWSRFGRDLKEEKKKDDSSCLLTAVQVRSKLKSLKKASDIYIGKMPLVKDSETKHILVTGSTGCGKTNLMHNLLPQVEAKEQPAIVIDQTGEIISKYYNPHRGDIIFNPFDNRSHAWDFWIDCQNHEELERFSNILFSFNRKKHGASSDPFWEKSAEIVFTSCYEYLVKTNNKSLDELNRFTGKESLNYLSKKLKGTPAERFLAINNSITASSILAVLATSTKPFSYLVDDTSFGRFSLKEYFAGVKAGKKGWLFLATKPSNRELTLPIISCLADLSLSLLMDIGINDQRRVWFVIDELAALGKLPALGGLMAEGRKYGACVLAGLQSLNQIYAHYGQHDGSTIFGQFGSKFFFRTDEPTIGKMISSMCGTETVTRQQKNTSFGANTYRDGQSYTEQEKSRNLVEYSDLTKLAVGECYVLLPEPEVRLSKIQVPEKNMSDKNPGFEPIEVHKKQQGQDENNQSDGDGEDAGEDVKEEDNLNAGGDSGSDLLSVIEDDKSEDTTAGLKKKEGDTLKQLNMN